MHNTFTLEQRKAAYEYALLDPEKGICVRLGRRLYGSYMASPWFLWGVRSAGFDSCIDYFPELKSQNVMPDGGPTGMFTKAQRIQILTKAIELCTPSTSL